MASDNISDTNESLTDPSPPPARKWKKGDKLNTSAPFQNAEGWKSFFFPLLQTLSYLVFANLTVYCFMPPSSPLFFSSASLFFFFYIALTKVEKINKLHHYYPFMTHCWKFTLHEFTMSCHHIATTGALSQIWAFRLLPAS